MFNSITGVVTAKLPQAVCIDTNGIEWEISVPGSALDAMPHVGEKARVYTWLSHREDAMSLYGFATPEDRALFLDLLKVDGIGARGALKILSAISGDQLERALEAEDITRLETVPGIGKKTAQKMMLALRGKLSLHLSGKAAPGQPAENPLAAPWHDVIVGLSNMGYDRRDCEAVIIRLSSQLAKDGASGFAGQSKNAQEEVLLRRAIVELAHER
jgi:Holliday junction DNA helicase RuvA